MLRIIEDLFGSFSEVRYVAVYADGVLTFRQREQIAGSSSADTDRFEELLVNPALLTLARQRGNIDCGGLRFMIVAYGNFYQLIKEINGGHISICLDKGVDLACMPARILTHLETEYPGLF